MCAHCIMPSAMKTYVRVDLCSQKIDVINSGTNYASSISEMLCLLRFQLSSFLIGFVAEACKFMTYLDEFEKSIRLAATCLVFVSCINMVYREDCCCLQPTNVSARKTM